MRDFGRISPVRTAARGYLFAILEYMIEDVERVKRWRVAEAVAREAGALQKRRFLARTSDEVAYQFKGPQDYLTATDGEVERLVHERLLAAFPTDTMLGEEGGGEVSAHTWVVDPIDGTSNFARGIPHFCVSIALVEHAQTAQGQATIGVIYAPMVDELYSAASGHGAWLNGESMHVSSTTRLSRSLVELGWAARQSKSEYLEMLQRGMNAGLGVRGAGSGSLAAAQVAAGRVDACVELHMYAWDWLAGMVMAREAGAKINRFLIGDALRTGNFVFAAAPGIADELAATLGVTEAMELEPLPGPTHIKPPVVSAGRRGSKRL